MADIFTDVGENLTADLIDGTSSAPTNWFIGWGTGGGTAAKGDTTLFTEAAETRIASTTSQPSANQNQFVATITSASGQTITNAGVFTLVTSGIMLLKSNFTGIALAIGDKIAFTFQLDWS